MYKYMANVGAQCENRSQPILSVLKSTLKTPLCLSHIASAKLGMYYLYFYQYKYFANTPSILIHNAVKQIVFNIRLLRISVNKFNVSSTFHC